MPMLREVHLPTGLTITQGCTWPGGLHGWAAGDARTQHGRAAAVGAHAAARAGAEDVHPARAQDDMGAVGGQTDL